MISVCAQAELMVDADRMRTQSGKQLRKSAATKRKRATTRRERSSAPLNDHARRRAVTTSRRSAVRPGASGDRERLRTALHDGLGQLLTSISFLASSLKQKLAARKLPEASEAAEILSLTGRAISETQSLARGNNTPPAAG
jgi:signal transduction histidine kinase